MEVSNSIFHLICEGIVCFVFICYIVLYVIVMLCIIILYCYIAIISTIFNNGSDFNCFHLSLNLCMLLASFAEWYSFSDSSFKLFKKCTLDGLQLWCLALYIVIFATVLIIICNTSHSFTLGKNHVFLVM